MTSIRSSFFFSWLWEKLVRRHANKNLCILTCLLLQVLTPLQAGIDHATQLVDSIADIDECKNIDCNECTKAMNRLDNALGNVPSWVDKKGGSPDAQLAKLGSAVVTTVAKKLKSHLNVTV